jgi:signal transduction histidine kinase
LNLVVEDALSNLDQVISKRGARVTHDDLPSVFGHAPLLTQLLQNLIGNGIKYCEADTPTLRISAHPEANGFWRISVRDNGIGIDEKFYRQIFEPFERLHGRGKYEGTGLGLATCKKIVERHGGRIWCESNQDGGTTFNFSLPASAAGLKDSSDDREPGRAA